MPQIKCCRGLTLNSTSPPPSPFPPLNINTCFYPYLLGEKTRRSYQCQDSRQEREGEGGGGGGCEEECANQA